MSIHQTILTFRAVGEEQFTTPGTYSWVAPFGVHSVSVVCVGGGGGGSSWSDRNHGGGGGGLGYKNNISVIPGTAYTVVVGTGGTFSFQSTTAFPGGNSFFISLSTVAGYGGVGGRGRDNNVALGGTYFGDGGGNGGSSPAPSSSSGASGGGGAGGYSGNGGDGGDVDISPFNGSAGSGGAGGGGGAATGANISGAGGGVGIFGEGSNGAAGTGGVTATDGGGGSGGQDGSTVGVGTGGLYGGGGASQDGNINFGGRGGNGVVRIIWGEERLFPSTLVGIIT